MRQFALRLARLAVETAVALLGAGLFATTILISGWSLLCLVALVPWAVLYGRPGTRTGVLPALVGSLAWYLTVCQPMLKYGVMVWGILALEGAILFGGALLLLRWTSRTIPGVPIALRLPVIWVALEWIYVRVEVFRLPIFLLPYPLADWPVMVQAADLLGGFALTVPVAMVNGAVADLLVHAWTRRGRVATGGGTTAGPTTAAIRLSAAVSVALLGFMLVYGWIRIDRSEPAPGPRVALIQPSLPHVIGWPVGVHIEEVFRTARDVPAGETDLILWPENAILDFYDRPNRYMEDMTWLARTKNARILFGAMGRSADNPFRTTNEAVLLNPEGTIEGTYAKIDVIPWAEYFPLEALMRRYLPRLEFRHRREVISVLTYFPTGTPGDEVVTFPYVWRGMSLPFAVALCSESGVPARVRAGARLGASFLVNLISEGDVGGRVQLNMLRLCRLRAIEHRRPFIRVGNTGISCVIDESGRVTALLRGEVTGATIEEPGVLLSTIPLPKTPRRSIYTSLGDLVSFACLALCVLFAGSRVVSRLGRKRGGIAAASLALLVVTAGCRGERIEATRDFEGSLREGIEAFEEGRNGTALRVLRRASLAEPERAEPYAYIAEIFRRTKQPFRGYSFFAARRDLAAGQPEIATYLGYFAIEVHYKEEAARVLGRVLEQEPHRRQALLWFSTLLLDANRAGDLRPYLETYLEKDPDDVDVRMLLAESLLALGRTDESIGVLEGILESDPGNADALRFRGQCALSEDRLDEALDFLEASREAEPRKLDTYYHLARVALKRGDLDEARRVIDTLHEVEEAGFH